MDGVVAFPEQSPADRELEAPLRAVVAVPRDRVAVPERRRPEDPAPTPRRPVHLDLQPRRVSGREGDAQGVGAAGHDVVQVEPDLPRRRHDVVADLSARQINVGQ